MAWQKRGKDAEGGKFHGGTWHVFPHSIEKTYVDGEIVDRILWRGVVYTKKDGKLHWKASQDKKVVERWVKDKIVEFFDFPKPKQREEKVKKRKNRNAKKAKAYLETLKIKKNKEK